MENEGYVEVRKKRNWTKKENRWGWRISKEGLAKLSKKKKKIIMVSKKIWSNINCIVDCFSIIIFFPFTVQTKGEQVRGAKWYFHRVELAFTNWMGIFIFLLHNEITNLLLKLKINAWFIKASWYFCFFQNN